MAIRWLTPRMASALLGLVALGVPLGWAALTVTSIALVVIIVCARAVVSTGETHRLRETS